MQVKDLRPGPEGQPPVIKTNSPMVKKAREGVMEFLLINHPLDCPICDQGGECDLQDQAMAYGVDFSRYREPKRATENLDLGPLVETHMTRCISCTRCVRFTTEVAGISQMGQTGRGEDAEITSYLGKTLNSNIQGNIIDLCPVGALVSKPYAFTARPWELTKTETIDVMDSLCANIRVDTKGREVMRILPRNHDGINEEWISDKTRFVWDGLRLQRLDVPYIREHGKLKSVSWDQAINFAVQNLKNKKVGGIVGDLVSVEAAFALKQLINSLDGLIECRVDGIDLPTDNRSSYVGNASIEEIDSAKEIIIIGADPINEVPILNARIRKAWLNGCRVSVVGPRIDMTFEYEYLGDDRSCIDKVIGNKDTLVIVGLGALQDGDSQTVLEKCMSISKRMLVLHSSAGRVGALDIGCTSENGILPLLKKSEVIINLGVDEVDIEKGPFVIYQGSHGDRGAHRADIIFPSAAYTEENGTFVNTEGRAQLAIRAGFPPGEAKENWAILRALSGAMDKSLPFDNLGSLREKLFEGFPNLAEVDTVPLNPISKFNVKKMKNKKIRSIGINFYQSNPIARASRVMADLSSEREPLNVAAE
jgi:NADH-quinone oxidoreductase subunit G